MIPILSLIMMTSDPYHTIELLNNNFENLSRFSFNGIVSKAKVVNVYDGDTVTIVFFYQDKPIKDSFRMLDYDTPELKPSLALPHRDLHIQAAKCARDYLKSLILNQLVWVKFSQEDKYGRLMGHLYLINELHSDTYNGDETCINDDMLSKGYGKPYHGGHKEEFSEEELTKVINQ